MADDTGLAPKESVIGGAVCLIGWPAEGSVFLVVFHR
jgi:hypothetical protein